MLRKLITILVLMTLTLHGTFIMEKGEPLKKVKSNNNHASVEDGSIKVSSNNNPSVEEGSIKVSSNNNNPSVEKGSIDGAMLELYYRNKSGVNDGKDGVNNVGKYNKNIRLTFTPKQKYVSIGFTNIFEYSSIDETKDHGYKSCMVADEAHGITAGKVGVTSATYSLYRFINEYYNNPPFSKYLPELKRLSVIYKNKKVILNGKTNDYNSMSYVGGLKGLCDQWHKISATNPQFIKAQNKYIQDYRYLPAVRAAEKYNVHLPITLAMFYDTQVLQGNIDYVAKEIGRFNGTTAEEEIAWLKKFNAVRIRIIEREAYWGRGVSIRPKSFNKLIDEGYKNRKIWWLDIKEFTVHGNGWQKTHSFKYKNM